MYFRSVGNELAMNSSQTLCRVGFACESACESRRVRVATNEVCVPTSTTTQMCMQVALMQQKFKILSHSIDQLKQEIISKDQKLVKENFAHHRVENEIQTLRNDLTRIKKQIQSSEQIINNQISEIRKLSKIIADADAERLRQRKEFDAVIAERDMLGTQLIRRNNEVKALYEKIKIARSTLTKGEWTFEERIEEHAYLVDMIEEVRPSILVCEGMIGLACLQSAH